MAWQRHDGESPRRDRFRFRFPTLNSCGLFGFEVEGVDYEQPTETDLRW